MWLKSGILFQINVAFWRFKQSFLHKMSSLVFNGSSWWAQQLFLFIYFLLNKLAGGKILFIRLRGFGLQFCPFFTFLYRTVLSTFVACVIGFCGRPTECTFSCMCPEGARGRRWARWTMLSAGGRLLMRSAMLCSALVYHSLAFWTANSKYEI